MKNLSDLLKDNKKKENEFKIPDDESVECAECGWTGEFKDCGTEMVSEGWEYPEYTVSTCPKCGGYMDI